MGFMVSHPCQRQGKGQQKAWEPHIQSRDEGCGCLFSPLRAEEQTLRLPEIKDTQQILQSWILSYRCKELSESLGQIKGPLWPTLLCIPQDRFDHSGGSIFEMLARICPSLKTCATEHISILILFHTLPPFLLSVFPFCPLAYVSQNDPSKSMSMFRTFLWHSLCGLVHYSLAPSFCPHLFPLSFSISSSLPCWLSSCFPEYTFGVFTSESFYRPAPFLRMVSICIYPWRMLSFLFHSNISPFFIPLKTAHCLLSLLFLLHFLSTYQYLMYVCMRSRAVISSQNASLTRAICLLLWAIQLPLNKYLLKS